VSAVAGTLARALGFAPAPRTEPAAVRAARARLREAHADARMVDAAHRQASQQVAHLRELIADAVAARAVLTRAEAEAAEVTRRWAQSGAVSEPRGDAGTFSRLAAARIANLEAQTRAHSAARSLRALERRQADLADKARSVRSRIRAVAAEMLTARCLPLFEKLTRAGSEYFVTLDQIEAVKFLLSGAAAGGPTDPCYYLSDPRFFELDRAVAAAIAESRPAAPGTPGAARLRSEWLRFLDDLGKDAEAHPNAGPS
jgi:hypothetical protein